MDDPALMDAFDVNASSYYSSDGEVSFGSDGGHGGNGSGTKPAVTFEQFDVVDGNISFKVVLNDHNVPNLDYIKILGNFNGNSSDIEYQFLQSSLNPGAFLTDDGDIKIYGDDSLYAFYNRRSPHELVINPSPARLFWSLGWRRSKCNSSDWELQDLISQLSRK